MMMTLTRIGHVSPLKSILAYGQTSMAPQFANGPSRYSFYLLLTLMVGMATFAALAAYALLRPHVHLPMAFQGMYAWKTALNFGICHYLLHEWLSPRLGAWGTFENRTIGTTWAIGLAGFLIAFVVQRTLVFDAIDWYYPDLLEIFRQRPQTRPTHMQSVLFCLPFWGIIYFGLVEWARQWPHRIQNPERNPNPADRTGAPGKSLRLHFPKAGSVDTIDTVRLSHVSVEDHYCRFFLETPHDLEHKLIKVALKQVMSQLPQDGFVQVHRSHIVSLAHADRLVKKGRRYELRLKTTGYALPVSRHRLSCLPAEMIITRASRPA